MFTSFSYQDKRLDKSWWHLQSCIFDFKPLENAHFRAKNANRVIASARMCIYHGSKLVLKFASKVQELLLVTDHVIKKCAIKILTEKSHKEKF